MLMEDGSVFALYEIPAHIMNMVDDKKKEEQATDGTLYCAGMIAGEGLVGILLAILAVVNVSSVFDLSGSINLGNAGGVILMLLMILSLLKFSIWNKKKA